MLGGSFDPPTIAHKMILDAAVAGLNARLGIYLPASRQYIIEEKNQTEFLTRDVCAKMLTAMCVGKSDRNVCTLELISDKREYTFDTLNRLKEMYPENEICFIIGADKLNNLPNWYKARELLNRFKIAVFNRDGKNAKQLISGNEFLSANREAFYVFDAPGCEGVSSAEFRRMYALNPEAAKKFVIPEVFAIYAELENQKQ